MKRIIAVLLCLCVGVSFLTVGAQGSRFYIPWELEFEEYGRIFIMTPRNSHLNEEWEEEFGRERLRIRSGLYYNTDPLVSIYYVDEVFAQGQTFFSRDGRFFALAEIPSLSSHQPDYVMRHVVLSFFEDGRVVSSYTLGDLIEDVDSLLAASVGSSGGVSWIDSITHMQQMSILWLTTVEGQQFTFDITTGEMLNTNELRLRTFLALIADIIASMLNRG